MHTHRLDLLSLLGGLVFVAIALVGLVDVLAPTVADLRWIGPALLVLFGIALVLGGARRRDVDEALDTADGTHDTDDLDGPADDAADLDGTAGDAALASIGDPRADGPDTDGSTDGPGTGTGAGADPR